MNPTLIEKLACPRTHAPLHAVENENAFLETTDKTTRFPVVNGIPRFVPPENYASSFGYQWNKFARLQLDSHNGSQFSRERFLSITGWQPAEFAGKCVLDVGCGSGRFAEIALDFGARVVAMDLSSAVEACKNNLGHHPNLDVVQASIYDLPFQPASFDFVYSIGVIQHTPDPRRSVMEICRMVKPGGRIALWIYERDWKSHIGTVGFKYLLRPLTKRLSRSGVEKFSNAVEALCWPILKFARHAGLPGKIVMRLLPAASAHIQNVPLTEADFREWVRLDTFDMYSPAHDHPQKFPTVASWLREAGFENIQRQPHGGISITATRPTP